MPMRLNILRDAPPTPPDSVSDRLAVLRDRLLALDLDASLRFFELPRHDRVLKTTISLCSQCLAHAPAIVYELDGRVIIEKRCGAHGLSRGLAERDAGFYFLSNKDRWGRRFADDGVMSWPEYSGGCCGDDGCCGTSSTETAGDFTDQSSNKSCTVLVEVTNACNLACPVCYSD